MGRLAVIQKKTGLIEQKILPCRSPVKEKFPERNFLDCSSYDE
jgi:hypothetical protein